MNLMFGAVRIYDPNISIEIITAWFRRVVAHTKVEDVSPARWMDFQLMYTWYQLISRLYISLHPFWHVNPTWYLWLAANKPCSKDKRWCGESSPGVAPTRWMLQHALTWNLISKPAWCRDGFHQFFHLQCRSIQQTERPISDVCNNIPPRHRQQTATEFPRAGEAVGVEKLQQGFEGGHIAICNGNLLPPAQIQRSQGQLWDLRWFQMIFMDFHGFSHGWFRVVFQTREFFRKSPKPAPWRSTPEDQWWVASQRLQSEHKGSENELWWSHHSPRRWRHLKSGFTGFAYFFDPMVTKDSLLSFHVCQVYQVPTGALTAFAFLMNTTRLAVWMKGIHCRWLELRSEHLATPAYQRW